jgi:hypothetical protein
MRPGLPFTLVLTVQSLLLASASVGACDTDADCGVGGTCIKREKRASGVCYGGSREGSRPEVEQTPSAGGHTSADQREMMKEFLGDPDQIIKQQLPGHEVGEACIVTQDCPAGFDCVHAGFEGRCVKL